MISTIDSKINPKINSKYDAVRISSNFPLEITNITVMSIFAIVCFVVIMYLKGWASQLPDISNEQHKEYYETIKFKYDTLLTEHDELKNKYDAVIAEQSVSISTVAHKETVSNGVVSYFHNGHEILRVGSKGDRDLMHSPSCPCQ